VLNWWLLVIFFLFLEATRLLDACCHYSEGESQNLFPARSGRFSPDFPHPTVSFLTFSLEDLLLELLRPCAYSYRYGAFFSEVSGSVCRVLPPRTIKISRVSGARAGFLFFLFSFGTWWSRSPSAGLLALLLPTVTRLGT